MRVYRKKIDAISKLDSFVQADCVSVISASDVASVLKHSGVADSLPFWEAEGV